MPTQEDAAKASKKSAKRQTIPVMGHTALTALDRVSQNNPQNDKPFAFRGSDIPVMMMVA